MTVRYLTSLYLKRDKEQIGTAIFVLTKEYRVVVKGHTITVPAGFTTDFSSVPRMFRWLVSVVDGLEGSVVHDWIYRCGGDLYTRLFADEVLAEMDKDQMGWLRRNSKYLGVRLGGWYTWRRGKNRSK